MSGSGVEAELVGTDLAELRTGWDLPLARGVYYRPAGRLPRVAFLATHYDLDFSHHYLAGPLAAYGYGFLGWNTRFCGREGYFLLDRALVDIGAGVRWLRRHGAEAVVLLGNSGGGSLLAAYQAQSTSPVVRPPPELTAAPGIDALERGDLYVSLAAHPGRPEVLTNWLDPSATDERDPVATDPSLDMYDADNGPPYSEEFIQRYRSAQRARNRRITDWCEQELQRIGRAGYRDRLFTVHRTWADPRFADPGIDPSDRQTPACYLGDPERANRGVEGLARWCSLRSWLSMWSLDRSQCRSEEYLPAIDVPSLVIQASADAGVFPSDAQAIFDGLGAADRQLVHLPGDHYFREPATARAGVAELIAQWTRERAGES